MSFGEFEPPIKPEVPDEHLVSVVQHDPHSDASQRAFAIIHDRHVGVMAHVAGKIVGQHDAEEIAYTGLTNAWLGMSKGIYDPERGSLRNWLCGITARAAIDARRRRAVRPTDPMDPSVIASIDDFAAPEQGSREPGIFDQVLSAIAESVKSKKQREILIRTALGEESLGEIAREKDTSLSTIKSHLRLARGNATQSPELMALRDVILD
jgi:RNA polymerase sigma factor (sigma-70 family)